MRLWLRNLVRGLEEKGAEVLHMAAREGELQKDSYLTAGTVFKLDRMMMQ